jgi:hypothetical protein
MPVAQWLPIIETEVEHIIVSRSLCDDCRAVEVSWPTRRCAGCQKARRRETYRNAKERKRIKEQTRKCATCDVDPLGTRQRVCSKCKANTRQERNLRYKNLLTTAIQDGFSQILRGRRLPQYAALGYRHAWPQMWNLKPSYRPASSWTPAMVKGTRRPSPSIPRWR